MKAPSTSGPYAYSPPYSTAFLPGQPSSSFPANGQTYIDPIFGRVVRRITEQALAANSSDIYSRNAWWSADNTYCVITHDDATVKAVNVNDATTKPLINNGGLSRANASCSPVDADDFYFFDAAALKKISISGGSTTTVKTFGSNLGDLGGSHDWFDASGRYCVFNFGTDLDNPSFRVWDKQTDTLYSGAITTPMSWITMSPGADYLVGNPSGGNFTRYKIMHGTQSLQTTSDFTMISGVGLFGTHADVCTASDGRSYLIRPDPDDNPTKLLRFDLETGAKLTILTMPSGNDYWKAGINHVCCGALGAGRDWCVFESDEPYDHDSTTYFDNFDYPDPVAFWGPITNEICAINVLSGTFKRLVHHRTRFQNAVDVYNYEPRPSLSWDGSKIVYASNYGYRSTPDGYCDHYCIATGIS